MMFSVITLFPEMFSSIFEYSIIKRARDEKKLSINFINLRDFGIGNHKTVDDKPYGGGVGMVIRVDVVHKAILFAKKKHGGGKVVLLDAKGEAYSQKTAEKFSKEKHLIIVCGRYEGFDQRIDEFVDYSISAGDYILTGGEIPAMTIIDSVTRLLPSVLLKESAVELESFSKKNNKRLLEYPQYTRPEVYKNLKVPEILLSGNERKINEYRNAQSIELTKKRRPDLL